MSTVVECSCSVSTIVEYIFRVRCLSSVFFWSVSMFVGYFPASASVGCILMGVDFSGCFSGSHFDECMFSMSTFAQS